MARLEGNDTAVQYMLKIPLWTFSRIDQKNKIFC